jgi:serine protease Do
MSLFASAGKIRTTGVALILLGSGMMSGLSAQDRAQRKVEILDVDGTSFLGVRMEDVTAENMAKYKLTAERGVIVKSVEKGSPAEAANLREDDVILEYEGMPVFSTMQLARMVRETPVGRKVAIVVSRDGKKVDLAAQIGRREGPLNLGEGFSLSPWGGEGRGFQFFGPEGHSFQFRIPEGRGFMYGVPGTGDRFFSLQRPRLGVTLEPVTDQMAAFLGVPGKKGLLVTSVQSGSPADTKLKAGDVIVQADNKDVAGPDDLARIVQNKGNGQIDLKIIRDKREMSVSVNLPRQEDSKNRRGYRL